MVGGNLAITPGRVVWENQLCQLIHYAPTQATVYHHPLLIIPPWINKFYILDLQPHNSLVKYMVDQGHDVYIISWRDPAAVPSSSSPLDFQDYLNLGPLAVLQWMADQNLPAPNVVGYCIGGTLLGCCLAYLAAQPSPQPLVNSATFLTSLLDFSAPGELGIFISEEIIGFLETYMNQRGYLDGALMKQSFSSMRSLGLMWKPWVDNLEQEAGFPAPPGVASLPRRKSLPG